MFQINYLEATSGVVRFRYLARNCCQLAEGRVVWRLKNIRQQSKIESKNKIETKKQLANGSRYREIVRMLEHRWIFIG